MNLYGWFLHVSEKPDKIAFLSLFLNENVDSHVIMSFQERRKERLGGDGTQPRDEKKPTLIKMFTVLKPINTTKHRNLHIKTEFVYEIRVCI